MDAKMQNIVCVCVCVPGIAVQYCCTLTVCACVIEPKNPAISSRAERGACAFVNFFGWLWHGHRLVDFQRAPLVLSSFPPASYGGTHAGTLSPLDSFAGELGVEFPHRLEAPHVINVRKQCLVTSIGYFGGVSLDAR